MSAVASDTITLGIISALVAGNAEAVGDMLHVLASTDPRQADAVLEALNRGYAARHPETHVSASTDG